VAEALIPVSAGELVDKITILEIKSERMTDPQKLRNVRLELETLRRAWEESPLAKAKVSSQLRKLKTINAQLWEIEDRIRVKESTGSFDGEFIELARSIYLTNDERARVKREINELLGSKLIEEKSYASHRRTSG
jgi:predicted  nucleic acid-binding Zn-ribbon protein